MQLIERLIQELERVSSRKSMFIYPVNVSSIKNFLYGFTTVYYALDIETTPKMRREAVEKRGWYMYANGPSQYMRRKGLKTEQIIDELIAIEIEILREVQRQKASLPAA